MSVGGLVGMRLGGNDGINVGTWVGFVVGLGVVLWHKNPG